MYETGYYIEVTCVECSRVSRYTGVTSCLCKNEMKVAGWSNSAPEADPFAKIIVSRVNLWSCPDCSNRSDDER
jgi:hypothetical protein